MYCKKCGKFIGTDAELCDECAPKQAPVNDFIQQQTFNSSADTGYEIPVHPLPQPDTSEINLGKAIAAAILSFIGCFLAVYMGIFSMAFATFGGASFVLLLAIAFVPLILGLVYGIGSISNFKQTSHIRSGKRVPVLILGIASTVDSAVGLFLAFIFFLMTVLIGSL